MNYFALALNAAQTAEMDNFTLAMTVLLTGIVVVFSILLLLTFIIKVYSTVVHSALEKSKGKKSGPKGKTESQKPQPSAAKPKETPATPKLAAAQPAVEADIPGEVVAAIAAAVCVMNDLGKTNYSVKSVRRSAVSRPVWSTAGLMENTRPF